MISYVYTEERKSNPRDNQEVTFYTIGDSRFFLGVVGLLNSLRLTGHYDRVVVLDCGFTPAQRDMLKSHCTLFEMPRERVNNPQQYKPFPYLLNPRGTIVIIDGDMIVTRSLKDIIALGAQGKICVYPNPEYNRWFAEWKQLFDLSCEPRRQIYVASGFVCFSILHWPDLLERWWQSCERIFSHPTLYEGAPNSNPTAQSDQDALNAVLMSDIPWGGLSLQPAADVAFDRYKLVHVRVVDIRTLSCTMDGHAPVLIHNSGLPKLWERQAWVKLEFDNVYVRLLRRLLTGTDVALRISQPELPIWLRSGVVSRICTGGMGLFRKLQSFPSTARSLRWQHRVSRATQRIIELVPLGASFILVDDDQWETRELVVGRRRIPFVERYGHYWGQPGDDNTAIRELERLRLTGASHIAFAWPAFWWLDHYTGFRTYLESEFHCVLKNDDLVIFDLTRSLGACRRKLSRERPDLVTAAEAIATADLDSSKGGRRGRAGAVVFRSFPG
jgi:hypothetical protein